MSFLILTLTVKIRPPVFVDVFLFPFILSGVYGCRVSTLPREILHFGGRRRRMQEEEKEEGAGYWFPCVSDHLFLGNIQSSPRSLCSH